MTLKSLQIPLGHFFQLLMVDPSELKRVGGEDVNLHPKRVKQRFLGIFVKVPLFFETTWLVTLSTSSPLVSSLVLLLYPLSSRGKGVKLLEYKPNNGKEDASFPLVDPISENNNNLKFD